MKPWSLLFLPFAVLYALITDIRSLLYRKKAFFSAKFDVPTISVGNLRIGGTGKTPHIELLIKLFAQTHQVAILSRGYGRKTKGFRLANQEDTPKTIGDEPMQFYEKFGEKINVAVGEERALAIPELLYLRPETNLILLDDAFQHLAVKPSCSILLTEYAKPFYQDFVLPMGRLRERRKAAKRADIIVVSKCPEKIIPSQKEEVIQKISEYAPNIPIFFTKIIYGKPYFLQTKENAKDIKKVILLAAIANPNYFLEAMQEMFDCQAHFFFPDHHLFRKEDLSPIQKNIQEDTHLLCTEKDAAKLRSILPANILEKTLVMPIEVDFLDEDMKKHFIKSLQDFL
mgnify:CR=1 FL=1